MKKNKNVPPVENNQLINYSSSLNYINNQLQFMAIYREKEHEKIFKEIIHKETET